jgi:hypothetical protein
MNAKSRNPKAKASNSEIIEIDYPKDYYGQNLSEDYVFISEQAGKVMQAKHLQPFDYLQRFVKEVALRKTPRAIEYLKAYPIGQRFLWTFADDSVALFSLVVLLPEGPRTVMSLLIKEDILDDDDELLHYAELCYRWNIEAVVGTSTHPDKIDGKINQQDIKAGGAL